jgi:Rha family phage regulatory protein
MSKTQSKDEYEEPLLENDPGLLSQETGFSLKKAALSGESVSNYIEDTLPKLAVVDGKPVISSLEIAQMFGKEHKDVLKAIRNVVDDSSEEFGQRNFALTSYKDTWNREMPMCNLSRDGFSALAFSFTGKKAAAYREAYIRQFNAMEAKLVELQIQGIRESLPKAKSRFGTQSHAELLKSKFNIYGHELDILHEILGNMLNRVDGVLSEQNANVFKNVFMRDWEKRLAEAYTDFMDGTNHRLGNEFYKSIREIHIKRVQNGEAKLPLSFSREHAFSLVLHLLGEFCEEKYRGFWTGDYFGAPLRLKNGNDSANAVDLIETEYLAQRIEK